MSKEIDYNFFTKMDLRVGEVIEAEKVPKSRNLLKLIVDIGQEKPRQVISGISNFYDPEELIGKKYVFIVNLKPRKLMGLESQAMILAADVDREAVLLKVDEKYFNKVKPGSKIV